MDQLKQLFGDEYVRIEETIGEVELFAFRRDITGQSVVTVSTRGLAPRELACTMLEPDLGAAVAVVKLAVLRQLGELGGPWSDGRVWINDAPILGGSLIQALVVKQGLFDELFALTEAEAMMVAQNSMFAIDLARYRDPLAFVDPLRQSYWENAQLSDDALAGIPILTSKLARSAPLRRVEYTDYHRFLALTLEEPDGYLDDPENIEKLRVSEVIDRLYGIRTFFDHAKPGESVEYTVRGWSYSVT